MFFYLAIYFDDFFVFSANLHWNLVVVVVVAVFFNVHISSFWPTRGASRFRVPPRWRFFQIVRTLLCLLFIVVDVVGAVCCLRRVV